jgi:cytochrome P450
VADPSFDPLDPAHAADAPRLTRLRRRCAATTTAGGRVFVARDEAARAALRDYRSLSNVGAFRLDDNAGPPLEPTIVQLDPPRHTAMRRLLLSAFTTESVTKSEPFIHDAAHELVDAIEPLGRADLVGRFTGPLPARVIAHLLGVAEQDHELFYQWTVDITANIPHSIDGSPSWERFQTYLGALVDERVAASDPPDDLVTRLMHAEIEGRPLDRRQLTMTVFQLITAGNDTLNRLLANCVYELLRERDRWERLRADRSLVPGALEESLRHDPPIQWAMRTCVEPTQVGEVAVDPGTRVLVGLASANRDEAVWRDPDDFVIDRSEAASHLAFGHGIHMCLGASLARLEAPIALNVLLSRLPGLELEPGFVYEPTPSPMFRGPRRLSVFWR